MLCASLSLSLSFQFSLKVLEPKILTNKKQRQAVENACGKVLTQFPVGNVALALCDVDGWLESSISMRIVACLAGAHGLSAMSKIPY